MTDVQPGFVVRLAERSWREIMADADAQEPAQIDSQAYLWALFWSGGGIADGGRRTHGRAS